MTKVVFQGASGADHDDLEDDAGGEEEPCPLLQARHHVVLLDRVTGPIRAATVGVIKREQERPVSVSSSICASYCYKG